MNNSIHPFRLMTAVIVAACFVAGCSETVAPAPVVSQPAAPASVTSSPSSVVGIAPAEPAKDTTTTAAKSDVSKAQQSSDMPMPGQANDHSTLAPNASQKLDTNNR